MMDSDNTMADMSKIMAPDDSVFFDEKEQMELFEQMKARQSQQ